MLKGVKPNLALILSEAGDALLRDLKYQKCHPLYFIPIISKIFFLRNAMLIMEKNIDHLLWIIDCSKS